MALYIKKISGKLVNSNSQSTITKSEITDLTLQGYLKDDSNWELSYGGKWLDNYTITGIVGDYLVSQSSITGSIYKFELVEVEGILVPIRILITADYPL